MPFVLWSLEKGIRFMKFTKKQILAATILSSLSLASANATLITNGDFEGSTSGSWNGWTETRPAGNSDTMYLEDASGVSGTYLDVTYGGGNQLDIPATGGGENFVATDSETAGSNVLYQVFTMPTGTYTSLVISFDFFARNHRTTNVVGNDGLDILNDQSQFARVDILKSAAGNSIFDLSGSNVVGNLYSSITDNDVNPNGAGVPPVATWENRALTLYGVFTGTYVFRIAEVDSSRPFQFGVDNIVVNAVPEPASLALLGLGGLMMFRRRNKA